MDYFTLMRNFWDFAFENPDKIKPNHCALYCYTVELCNRMGWKEKFGLPTSAAKESIGIRSYNTYIDTLSDLVDWGFIKMIERSKNQHTSNIVALLNFNKANSKAHDKAIIKHATKQRESNSESISSIDKQDTNTQLTIIPIHNYSFDDFWAMYPNKVNKPACKSKFEKLTQLEKNAIENTLPHFINFKPFPNYNLPHPATYLNQRRWEDEIQPNNNQLNILHHEQFAELTTALRQADPRL